MTEEEAAPQPSGSVGSGENTVYGTVWSLALFSKVLGAFPLDNAKQKDGRKLKHAWIDLIHLWDFLLCTTVLVLFGKCSAEMILKSQDDSDEDNRSLWITVTYYVAAMRGTIQFMALHYFASDLPKLFTALEEFHQEIGAAILKREKYHYLTSFPSVIRSFITLILLEVISFSLFSSLNRGSIFLNGWPILISFIFANIWKELPMNVFVLICKYLTLRALEIRDAVQRLRLQGDLKDAAASLEVLRLRHAAISRLVTLLERCYGMQVALNLLFLLLDIVLQLYVYFVITRRSNNMLLILSVYYFISALVLLAKVDKLERTDGFLAEEISSFTLHTSPRDQQIQIQLFSAQLAGKPNTFSACGYFLVNNSLVAAIMGAAATYLVVLIQFAPYLQSLLKPNTTMVPPLGYY